jgi:hypothetical protein
LLCNYGWFSAEHPGSPDRRSAEHQKDCRAGPKWPKSGRFDALQCDRWPAHLVLPGSPQSSGADLILVQSFPTNFCIFLKGIRATAPLMYTTSKNRWHFITCGVNLLPNCNHKSEYVLRYYKTPKEQKKSCHNLVATTIKSPSAAKGESVKRLYADPLKLGYNLKAPNPTERGRSIISTPE